MGLPESVQKLILGHNQFFGISHLSSERAIARERQFSDVGNIVRLVRYAQERWDAGLMMSTHTRANGVAEAIRNDSRLAKDLRLHVLLPYMAKYVRLSNARGLVGMVSDILGQTTWAERFGLGLKAGMGVVKGDPLAKIRALIDIEMLPFKGLRLETVFLHNALTDLIAGFGMVDILVFFCDYVRDRYQATPGFCTLSFEIVVEKLTASGITDAAVMAPFNPVGYQMNPSRERCERAAGMVSNPIVAMSPLAAGHVSPGSAAQYLGGLQRIGSVVVGASSETHIDESFGGFQTAFEDR
jgi:hypothetical protein